MIDLKACFTTMSALEKESDLVHKDLLINTPHKASCNPHHCRPPPSETHFQGLHLIDKRTPRYRQSLFSTIYKILRELPTRTKSSHIPNQTQLTPWLRLLALVKGDRLPMHPSPSFKVPWDPSLPDPNTSGLLPASAPPRSRASNPASPSLRETRKWMP